MHEIAIIGAAWAEVLGALGRAGLDPAAMVDLLASTPVASPVMRGVAPTIVASALVLA